MTHADRAAAGVEALLDQQRQALLTGDLTALAEMPDRLARALQALTRQRPPLLLLTRVQAAADHNARLLLAAQRGLSQTRDRLGGSRAVAITTYDAGGHRAPVAAGSRLLSRR